MRLETPEGKKYYCGRLKWGPAYVSWTDHYVNTMIDGEKVKIFTKPTYYNTTKIVVFALDGKWYYVSDYDLRVAVRTNRKGLVFTTVGRYDQPKVRVNRAAKLRHLYAGRNYGLVGNSEIAKRETKDCTVTALMEAAHIPYDEAHVRLRPYRQERKGMYGTCCIFSQFPDFERVKLPGKITLGTFAKDAIGGRYFVGVNGHALAVVDGKIYDYSFKPGRKVQWAFKYIGGNE